MEKYLVVLGFEVRIFEDCRLYG